MKRSMDPVRGRDPRVEKLRCSWKLQVSREGVTGSACGCGSEFRSSSGGIACISVELTGKV